MNKPRWIRRLSLAGVWAFAASTWSSIGYHMFGLPDVGLLVVVAVVAGILLWPTPAAFSGRRSLGKSAHAR